MNAQIHRFTGGRSVGSSVLTSAQQVAELGRYGPCGARKKALESSWDVLLKAICLLA